MIIDILIIMLLIIYSFAGYKKGMIISICSILSLFLAIYLSHLLLPTFTQFVTNALNIDISQNYIKDNPLISNLLNNGKFGNILKLLLNINNLDCTIVEFLINLLSFVVLLTIIRLVFKSFIKLIDMLIQEITVLGTFDRMIGLCFGFIKGVVIIGIVCVVLVSLTNFENFNTILMPQMSQSSLVYVFSDGAGELVETIARAIFK